MKRYHPLQAILCTQALSLSSRAFSSAATLAFVNSSGAKVPLTFSNYDNSSGNAHRAIIGISNHHISSKRSSACRRFIMSSTASSQEEGGAKNLVVDPFCFRQFSEKENSKGYVGAVFNNSIENFEQIVNSRYDPAQLKDGYAPFCKHLFIVNDFSDARINVLPITEENERYLRTKYEARNEKELPVLTRYFDRELLLKGKDESDVFPVAKYIDLILYSREQIEKENAAMGEKEEVGGEEKETAPWGIVSIKAQDVDREHPMNPITSMRNALGKDQGGSGVDLVRDSYMEAVEYWKDHANVL